MRVKSGITLIIMLTLSPVQAELITGTDDDATLPFWEWRNEYMTMRLVQRLPDQTRLFCRTRI